VALLVVFLGLTSLVVLEFTSARELGQALASATWYWIVVSAFLFLAAFYLYAFLYRLGLEAVEVRFRALDLLAPLMVSIFLNTAAPFGEAIFVDYAAERGRSGARAAAGVILVVAVDLGTTLPFVVAGLAFLRSQGKLPAYDVIVSLLFVFVILLFVAALWLGRVRRSWLETLLRFTQGAANRVARAFRQRESGSETWAAQSADQFSEAAGSMAARPDLLTVSVAVGLLSHVVNAAGLYTLFLAFGQHVAPGTVAAGFSMSIVLYVIAVTPQGVGAAEGVMSLLFTSMGVPAAIAVAVAVGYRVFNVWIPLVLGYLIARRMRIFGGRPTAVSRTTDG
jgi:uncharacterized protein (TIRG00374 family)